MRCRRDEEKKTNEAIIFLLPSFLFLFQAIHDLSKLSRLDKRFVYFITLLCCYKIVLYSRNMEIFAAADIMRTTRQNVRKFIRYIIKCTKHGKTETHGT